MNNNLPDGALEVFTTCPPLGSDGGESQLTHLIDVARWSEEHGCKGILVFSDNSQLDAWLLSHVVIQHTRALCPLVAIQPIYMHPYTVANTLTSIGHLYHRRLYLNMVAGGFKNDLLALNDTTPHDQRYDRLIEYTLIIKKLLEGSGPVSFAGDFYKVEKLNLTPPLAPEFFPGIFVSGSSDAGVSAARAIGATAIKYPKPANEEDIPAGDPLECGIRVGVITRPDEEEARRVALSRFPEDRKGQLTRQLASKVSDSVWHHQLSELETKRDGNPYWLAPFQNYKAMCPYLVGSYEQVAEEMSRYFSAGFRRVILDVPPGSEDLAHTFAAFKLAMQPVH